MSEYDSSRQPGKNSEASASGVMPDMPGTKAAATRGGTIAALGLLIFMLLGLGLNTRAWLDGQLPDALPTLNSTQWLNGAAGRAIAAELAQTPLPQMAARAQRVLGWWLVGDLGPQVRQGCPGWLFLAEELGEPDGGLAALAQRVQTLAALEQKLAQRGVRLVVAVVPDKRRMAAAYLCGLAPLHGNTDRTLAWRAAMQRAGVAALDLGVPLQALGAEAFQRSDTHWSEAGAHRAAQAIAEAVRANGTAVPGPSQPLQILPGTPVSRAGDLVRLAGLDWLPQDWLPAIDELPGTRFQAVPQAAGETLLPAAEQDDLFGDSGLPAVVLLGTSYSRNANFAEYLALELGTPVVNQALDGGGFSGAASAYFAGAAFGELPPALIIWEVPERYLFAPLAQDQDIHLRPPLVK
ncbi:Cell division protein FtsQ [Kerstersia similis]